MALSMRRIFSVIAVAALMAAMVATFAVSAFAAPGAGSAAGNCRQGPGNPVISDSAKLPDSTPVDFFNQLGSGYESPGQAVKELCSPGQEPK